MAAGQREQGLEVSAMRIDKKTFALVLTLALLMTACVGPQSTGPAAEPESSSAKEMVSDLRTENTDGAVHAGAIVVLAKKAITVQD